MKSPGAGRLLVRPGLRVTFIAVVALFACGALIVGALLIAGSGAEPQAQATRLAADDPGPVAGLPTLKVKPVAAIPRKLRPTRAEMAAREARIRQERRRAAARRKASQAIVSAPAPPAQAPAPAAPPAYAPPAPPTTPVAPAPAPQAPTPVPRPAPQPTPPPPVGFDDSG